MSFSGSPSAHRRASSRTALLAGVSGMALSVGVAQAAAPRTFSPAWFAARVDATTASAGAAAAGTAAATLGQVAKSDANLATLAARLQTMQAAQQAAASAAAAAASSVPNGNVPGGLDPAPGATPGSALWLGAMGPTDTTVNGRDEVGVVQTAPQAMLTWKTFNVGSKTDLKFDQSAGGANASNWVVLNQVEDPAAAPSQILGSISAPGKVYIINANGIVFGAGSQVNLGSLIASTASISAAQFATGIYGAISGDTIAPSFTGAAAGSAVTVQQGATITTAAPGSVTAGGGSVLLLGGAVENDGVISTPDGQTILSAGTDFTLRQGYSSTGNQIATVQGSQIDASGSGTATNTGLITATTGDITLNAETINQAGIVEATTSVNQRGTVHLINDKSDIDGVINLSPGSVTVVNPDNAATTALDTQRQADITQSAANNALRLSPAGAQLGDISTLPDRLDEGRVEIVTGGTVGFGGSSLTMSQGGQIAVQAERAAAVEDGAILDVSGSTGAVLPASSTTLSVNIQGNELRDAPVNRDTGLISSTNVTLSISDLVQVAASASDPNVRDYTAGGLLEVSGYLANIGHTIDEWAAVGGTITLAAAVVITAPQSSLNVTGGAVTVAGGLVGQSYLIGADGQLYNVNTAPANIQYVGVYNGDTVSYDRFGGSDTYNSAVAAPTQVYQDGYVFGRDAGSVVVSAYTGVLEGPIQAGATNGAQQTGARAAGISDPYAYSQDTIALPGTLALGGFNEYVTPFRGAAPTAAPFDATVTIAASTTPEADSIIASGVVPAAVRETYSLSAPLLNADGLGGLSILTGGTITVSAPVSLAPGGTLTLQGAGVAVGASLTARGGAIVIGDDPADPVTGAATPLIPTVGGGGVVVDQGVTLDLRGEWTNAAVGAAAGAANLSGLALVNGGNLAVDELRALYLAPGSVVDASSGGAILAGGKQVGGSGGNVTLIADDPTTNTPTSQARNPARISATLIDYGVNGGGTLTLTAPYVTIGATTAPLVRNTVLLAAETFQTGFHDYVINGFDGLDVLPATVVSVAEPVYAFFGGSLGAPIDAPTGTDPAQVFGLILPPTYVANRTTAKLTQRQGASVAFISNDKPGLTDAGGGAIDLGAGSSITVDPGQSVQVQSYGQLTDDAVITAPGGSVSLVNEQANLIVGTIAPVANALSLSVYVGSDARIDVAGIATTATDLVGRPFGVVTAGGSVTLGSAAAQGSLGSTDALVLVEPGAVIDAAGASATIDLLAGTAPALTSLQGGAAASDPILVASNGGTIAASSYSGIALDGTMLAQAGGAGAAGGTLAITLETPTYGAGVTVPDKLQQPRVITISQDAESIVGDQPLLPGAQAPLAAYGNADISQQQIDAGGFGTLNLLARDAFSFQGDVALSLSGSVSLNAGIISDSSANGVVSIDAPYVSLSGQTGNFGGVLFYTINGANWRPYDRATNASFTVNADLIDIANTLRFGVSDTESQNGQQVTGSSKAGSRAGFAQIALNSSGDIRFGTGTFTTPGDLTLTAAQLYPTTGSIASIYAGYDEYKTKSSNIFLPDGTISVHGLGGAAPAVPYSVGGQLSLFAGAIVQDGVIRAPEGAIILGGIGTGPSGLPAGVSPTDFYTYTVDLGAGSITSVSLDGITVPYGGTVDGVTYAYNGSPVTLAQPSVTIGAQAQDVAAGALLDLSGGGTLAGAGFITGRGGSTDVLTNPFLVFNPSGGSVSAPGLGSTPVYAIVPGYGSGYAPTSPLEASGSAGSVPALGSQITIGAGVPGVAAGTYTLLPAYYALLPGAARVQIDSGSYDSVPGVTALGAGSYELNATTSVANTGVQAARPVAVVVTTGAGVLLNSQFDTETYSQFAIAQAAQFGTPRGALPEDGKTLALAFPQASLATTALTFDGTADFARQADFTGYAANPYFDGQAEVGGHNGAGQLEVTPDGGAPMQGYTGIDASALNAIGAPRLILGGTLQVEAALPTHLQFVASDTAVVVDGGATLSGPELFLVAGDSSATGGAVTVSSGATLDTLPPAGSAPAAPPFDSTNGYYYDSNGYTVLALSNGQLTFLPVTAAQDFSGQITVDGGSQLLTAGTLNFATEKGLSLSTAATYGAKYLSFSVNTINLVSDAALAETVPNGTMPAQLVLPSGLTLTQDILTTLLSGDTATGTPALQSLTLSAAQSINFAGSVSLDTGNGGLQQLVLNTPAIYGFGSGSDTATIKTGTLYWNGVETTTNIGSAVGTPTSALPGGVVANGPGTGLGTLDITAQNIILGYGPNTQPDTQTTLDRLIEGFSTVDLAASGSISGAERGTLSVYEQAAAVYGQPGSGGALNIYTPLLTGAAGSTEALTAGGALTIAAAAPGTLDGSGNPILPSAATSGALGAQIDLVAQSISDDSTILLNSGRLTMTATGGDIVLGANSRADLAGQSVALLDQTVFSGGGSVVLAAGSGNITAVTGSAIDVSAPVVSGTVVSGNGAAAGSIQATALAGMVAFDGSIAGGAGAGQTSGSFDVRAGSLSPVGAESGFDALNAALDAGGVYGSRSFEVATGDLTVDATVTAHDVSITADAGSLQVTATGVIDASGAAAGSIALNAGGDLTLDSGALLDAHGSVLQADSYGAGIAAENRAQVALTTSGGALTLGDATINVSAPGDANAPGYVALGQVILDAPRVLSGGAETGDVAISASGPVTIVGAQSVVLYGSRTYAPTDANGTIEQSADGAIPGAVSLDQLNADNTGFMDLAAGNAGLAADTAGLRAYAAYQLRPADVIQSSAASGGNLTVNGDLNLALLRYDVPVGDTAPGAGIAGLLSLRAANNLVVNGSITDGFATPADAVTPTKDDNGWTLFSSEPLGQQVILPTDAAPVTLANGTQFLTSNVTPLNYDITIGAATLAANVVIPTSVVTAKTYTVPAAGLTATAAITGPDDSVIATAGQVLAPGVSIPAGSTLGQGSVVPFAVKVASGTVWKAGDSLSLFSSPVVTLRSPGGALTLAGGDVIPIGATLVFENGKDSVQIRPKDANGQQGLIYAVANLLPAGSQSWSINLVGGANLASANVLAVQPVSALAADAAANGLDPAGSIVLSDTHYTLANKSAPTASFSVVRTGTGALNLVAGGNVDEASLFGVYTAGTQTSLGSAAQDAAFQVGRAQQAGDGTVLGKAYNNTYGAVIAGQQANYPDQGGDVVVSAQAGVLGEILEPSGGAAYDGTDAIGNWLWKQGGTGLGQSTAWWINFGSYVLPLNLNGSPGSAPVLAGFTGIGALGGGNVTVSAGGDAGEISGINAQNGPLSQGLVIAVASTGRVTDVTTTNGVVTGGTTVMTGGGLLRLSVAGTLNPGLGAGNDRTASFYTSTLGGDLIDLRGDTSVTAGQIGRIDLVYDDTNPTDPRPQDPFTTQFATSSNGLVLVPGDGTVTVDAMRDLVLDGAGDPGREAEQALTFVANPGVPPKQAGNYAGNTGFSLWTEATAIDLFSAGGNLTPATAAADGSLGLQNTQIANDAQTDLRFIYPSTLYAVAASGSMYYGQQANAASAGAAYSVELAPSATGELSLLAANSIYAHGYAIDMSGADDSPDALPNPFNPAYTDASGNPFGTAAISNFLNTTGNVGNPDALFGFEADTPTGDLHAGDTLPARIYAASGDLVDVQFGEVLNFNLTANEPVTTWYLAAKPAWIMAGGDIVSSGTRPSAYDPALYGISASTTFPNEAAGVVSNVTSGNLLLNLNTTDISVVSAGRDILSSYFYVAGPGLLEVDAGRNINDTGSAGLDFGVLKSLGPIFDVNPTSRSGGAGIAVLTGAGSSGPAFSTFADLYLNPANQADLSIPLSDPANAGKVQQTYQDQLYAWLQTNYGYTGSETDQLAFFEALPATQQDVFDREVFYDELNASGLQESDPTSLFYGSYARGKLAIATLFPDRKDASGNPIPYDGSLTMDSGTLSIVNGDAKQAVNFDAGISTLYGGTVQILSPGGGDIFGTTGGPSPGASSGVITSGSGDIDIFAQDSVLLGQSRIFTTFGGNILIWSAQGDINAGRGSKTTILYQPPLVSYSSFGGVTLSPAAPTSGAGIATLAPIAGTLPGDVNLIAPMGTIDAGEAGIRVSGNLNIAALTVLNTANVSVGGKTTGNTAVTATNVAAATTAAAATGSAIDAATNNSGQKGQQATQQPSVITVEIIGGDNDDEEQKRRRKAAA